MQAGRQAGRQAARQPPHLAAALVVVLRVGRERGVALAAAAAGLGQADLGGDVAAIGGVALLLHGGATHQHLPGQGASTYGAALG